jgi:hypothetical protein
VQGDRIWAAGCRLDNAQRFVCNSTSLLLLVIERILIVGSGSGVVIVSRVATTLALARDSFGLFLLPRGYGRHFAPLDLDLDSSAFFF